MATTHSIGTRPVLRWLTKFDVLQLGDSTSDQQDPFLETTNKDRTNLGP
jgi:hypothetical protein